MKTYCITFFSTVLAILAAVGTFNYVVDPYVIYSFATANEEKLNRLDQFSYMRLSKPWHLDQIKPNALVIGTSRTGRVSPEHSAWSNLNPYNSSIPGMTMYEMSRFIQHAQSLNSVQELILGLDFEQTLRPLPVYRPGFEENRFLGSPKVNKLSKYTQKAIDIVETLFSASSLSRSVSAITGTGYAGRKYFLDGTWQTTSKFLRGEGGYKFIGAEIVKTHKNFELDIEENMRILEEILRSAYANKINTRIFITPVHVAIIDLWYFLGHKENWEIFHQKLIDVNIRVAQDYNAAPYPIWVFNNLPGVVDEPVLKGPRAAEAWFKDGVHFRRELGGKIFSSMVLPAKQQQAPPFGMQLNADNKETYFKEVNHLISEWQKSQPVVAEKMRALAPPGY